jgi:hypothetical protein
MKKYLIIFSVIIILYYIQKYCIQSEVDKFLITQNVIEKFRQASDIEKDYIKNLTIFANQLQNGGLDISNGIILRNNLKINSNYNPNIPTDISNTYLKITDMAGNFKSMRVKNMDISGILTVRQTAQFSGSNNFSNTNNQGILNISSLPTNNKIHSENGDLIISSIGSASDLSNYIKLNNNTCISGNLTINGIKPILTKVIPITTSADINTNVSRTEYPGISFAGYINTNVDASTIEFNAFEKAGDPNWHINFTPLVTPTSSLGVRLTFYHKNIVEVAS